MDNVDVNSSDEDDWENDLNVVISSGLLKGFVSTWIRVHLKHVLNL